MKKIKTEIYKFYHDDECVFDIIFREDEQCAGISGRISINESCGGCCGCLLAQNLTNDVLITRVNEDEGVIEYKVE